MIRVYTYIWLFISGIFSLEFYHLNYHPKRSLLAWIIHHFHLTTMNLSPEPGRPISLWLGWLGIGIMLITNLYVLKKRFGFLSSWGKMSGWLDFHIFCGLVGPTFIFFHCNFKVRGLVGISFWSMVISLSSGIVGRYFYIQLVSKKKDLEISAEHMWEKYLRMQKRHLPQATEESLKNIQAQTIAFIGLKKGEDIGPLEALFNSLIADIKLRIWSPATLVGMPAKSRILLREYAMLKKRSAHLVPFQKLMSYWHVFHLPFAIFMYIAAVIHIASSLILGVVTK